jgi:hypothetical protein
MTVKMSPVHDSQNESSAMAVKMSPVPWQLKRVQCHDSQNESSAMAVKI